MEWVEIEIEQLDSDLPLPQYMTRGSSGMDLYARRATTLLPRQIKLIPTGIKVGIPTGFELQIRPRSGLATQGVSVINSPGTIDPDYRGEIKVILINFGEKPYLIKRGDRIAQAVLCPVCYARLKVVNQLKGSERSHQGFGHTGR